MNWIDMNRKWNCCLSSKVDRFRFHSQFPELCSMSVSKSFVAHSKAEVTVFSKWAYKWYPLWRLSDWRQCMTHHLFFLQVFHLLIILSPSFQTCQSMDSHLRSRLPCQLDIHQKFVSIHCWPRHIIERSRGMLESRCDALGHRTSITRGDCLWFRVP